MIKVKQLCKMDMLAEEITCDLPYRIFVLEKGLGILNVDGKELDFRIGRTYFIPKNSIFKISGRITAGFLITIDEYELRNCGIHRFFAKKQTKLIDLCWTELLLICNEIRKLGNNCIIPIISSNFQLLPVLLRIDNRQAR